ncbi:MAG: hypothetical protein IKP28_00260 [Clostridia bacterium]|nr:hypothetical protein [Clostridia bacterium]
MTTNPMQRKARNSFLLGMLVMLLISGIAIGFLTFLLLNQQKEQEAKKLDEVQVYILDRDVAAGEIVTQNMYYLQSLPRITVPANAVISDTNDVNHPYITLTEFNEYFLAEKNTGYPIECDEKRILFN